MKTITCKAQWLVRDMTSQASMDGFEGPAKSTEVDDGYGNVMVRGQKTATFNTFFRETSRIENNPRYDGTIDIFDTPFNRNKIAAHIRSHDLRVVDRNLERQILSENPPAAVKRQRAINNTPEMPEGFDGTKVKLNGTIRDADPVEDAYAEDAVFTEVVNQPEVQEQEVPATDLPRSPSAAEVVAGVVPAKATKPPQGRDARALKTKAAELVPDVVVNEDKVEPKAE